MNNGGFLGINEQNNLTVGLNNPDRDFLYHIDDYVPNTHVWSFSSAGTSYISTPFPLTGYPFTAMVWFKVVNDGSNARAFVFNDNATNSVTWYLTSSNFWVGANASTGWATYSLTTDAWYCGVITQTATSSGIAYANGVILSNLGTSSAHSPGGVVAGSFAIGSRAGVNTLNGYVSAYAIWNKVLTSGEIYDIYNNGKPTRNLNRNFGNYQSAENLRGWWLPCDASWNGSYFDVPSRSGGAQGKSFNMTSGQLITTNLP